MTAEELEQQRKDDLEAVLATDHGKRVMKRILANTKIFHVSYNGNSNDTIFNDGKKAIGLRLMNEILEVYPRFFEVIGDSTNER